MEQDPLPRVRRSSKMAFIIFAFFAVLACVYAFFAPRATAPLIGGAKDAHGCLVAAGYSWCEARSACERSWERYCTSAAPKPVTFSCAEGKEIMAIFYPDDDQYVDLSLSDDRALSLPRAISGSGARYAKDDESFVFWNKGDTAFVTENGTTTFADCLLRPTPSGE